MNLETLRDFFMMCTTINVGLMAFWVIMILAAPDLVYKTQTRFFPLGKEQFQLVMYCFLGVFKLLVIVFNVVPWLALMILA